MTFEQKNAELKTIDKRIAYYRGRVAKAGSLAARLEVKAKIKALETERYTMRMNYYQD